MNKSQFNKYVRNALAKRMRNAHVEDADEVINVFTEAVMEALAKNDEVLLAGFGRFTKPKVEARVGRNPQTGKPIKIAAYMQPRFKAGIKLKEACNRTEKPKKYKN